VSVSARLLLSDLPCARGTFRNGAVYCPINSSEHTAQIWKKSYEAAPSLEPPKPKSWADVPRQLKQIYEQLLNSLA
jgi:hypothetical protein